jgi:hypothetical protein
LSLPIGSMYSIYANMWGILMVNVTIYSTHGSYGLYALWFSVFFCQICFPDFPGWRLPEHCRFLLSLNGWEFISH